MLKYLIYFVLISQLAHSQWEPCQNGIPNERIVSITEHAGKLYIGTVQSGIFISSNHGNNWINSSEGLLDTTVITINFINGNIFAGTRSRGVFYSSDDGSTWFERNVGVENVSVWSMAFDGLNIYLGTRDSGLYVSTDMGISWIRKSWSLYVSALEASNGRVYAGSFTEGVLLSTDRGETWTQMNNGIYDTDIRAMLVRGNELFVGTSALGIFHSTDSAESWHNEMIGMSQYGSVWSFAVSHNNIFLGSYDRGFYYSSNDGTTWTERNNGCGDGSITRLAVDDKYVFALTGEGLYRAKLDDIILSIPNQIFNTEKVVYNQFTNQLDISLSISSDLPYSFTLYDILGNPLIIANISSDNSIDMRNYPNGLYQYVLSINGNNITGKFLKIQ